MSPRSLAPASFRPILIGILRVAITLAVVALAFVAGRAMWQRYEVDPWTRDGRVRADVVKVSSDVPGLVTRVLVRENDRVTKGQVLFEVDTPRYRLALAQAQAAVASAQATAADAHSQLRRARMLGDLVSAEEREALEAKAETASASLEAARVAVNVARLNLERTLVRATVNGYVANLLLKPGDYLAAGAQGLAVVDADTMWIDGYFEETKLPRIHVGDRARVLLMGETSPIEGRVESIAPGIDDRERTNASNQLASVNPTFNWVRLAQRVPVRIALVRVPQDIRLIAGRTATVDVIDGAGRTVHAGDRS